MQLKYASIYKDVYPIELPPLRDRKEDIPLLVNHFIQNIQKRLGKKITGVSETMLQELVANKWPCNIRELEHTIERSMLLTNGRSQQIFIFPNQSPPKLYML